MNLNQKVTLSSEALSQQVSGETVIMDLASETYFGLDPVGTRIWELLQTEHSLQSVFDTLQQEYDVTATTLSEDLEKLLRELQQAGLATLTAP
ncbi:PqqD family protein [Halieaceae bacterium IMCC14734]|uniref:PqqD family protein n=1 Tax=Candidatus Litorirhabdus singularis TaxID=2518993 RepID=A0ABT3TDN0_9GAMM|nr:PqqD family protein [Candidatus Litorirhabdus singularis]MCX2980391.1 PqqD family protein [Candidatus Litorirhabdus singularis]